MPQVIHGDIGGNILCSDHLPPAVIDWPPYWRPDGFALAVAAVDAVTWEGASVALFDEWGEGQADWDQLLLRAKIYRVATGGRHETLGVALDSPSRDPHLHEPVVRHLLARAEM